MMMQMQNLRIAIVDDQPDDLAALSAVLSEAGFNCCVYTNGSDMIAALRRETFDLLLLDWIMPRASGLDVVSWIQENLTDPPPAIMLTSRDSKQDIIRALNAGAVDYIVKPGDPDIIAARILAACRRRGDNGHDEIVRFGDFVFDRTRQCVTFRDQTIELRAKEFQLARLLFDNLDRPLSRNYIMTRIWNASPHLETRTLDMHISRVRSKLVLRPERGVSLRTIFGFGYRLDSCTPCNDMEPLPSNQADTGTDTTEAIAAQ